MEQKTETEMIFAFVADPELGLTLNLSTKEDWDEFGYQSDDIPQDAEDKLKAAGYEANGNGIYPAGDKTIAQMTSEMEDLGFSYSSELSAWLEEVMVDDDRDRDEDDCDCDDDCPGCPDHHKD